MHRMKHLRVEVRNAAFRWDATNSLPMRNATEILLPQGTCASSLILEAITKAITNTLLKHQLEMKHFFYSRICVGDSSGRLHFDAESRLSCRTSSSSEDPMPFSVSAISVVGHLMAVKWLTHWNELASISMKAARKSPLERVWSPWDQVHWMA